MKLTKLLASFLLVGVLFSCSKEELTIEDTSAVNGFDLVADLGTYEDTSLGMYKGVFTTADSEERGTVEIKVINDETAKATITYLSGEVEFFNGTVRQQNALTTNVGMDIKFDSGNSSFVFNVDADGSNPLIVDATSNTKASLITVVKENTRGAVTPLTGTFTSNLGASGTWNIIFNTGSDEGDNTDITTQSIFSAVDYGSTTGNSQSACDTIDGTTVTSCTIGGTYTSLGIDITWNGLHIFLGDDDPDCSSAAGTWTANGSSGSFVSDTACVGCLGSATTTPGTTGDIFDNTTQTFTADVTATGTIGTDAGLDNVSLNISHTFDGDLNISLESPAGTTVALAAGNGGGGENFTGTVFTDASFTNITTGTAPFTGLFNAIGGGMNEAFDGESVTGTWTLSIEDTGIGDEGTLDSWSIGICDEPITLPAPPPPPPGCNGTVTDVVGTAGAITTGDTCTPDTPDSFVADNSLGTGNIGVDADIENVTLNISHTFAADVEINLVSPTGTTLALSTGNGGTGANYTNTVFRDGGGDITAGAAPFTGEFQPQGGTFASAFDGETVTGVWTLTVCDGDPLDDGTLDSWSIGFCDENIAGFVSGQNDSATRVNVQSVRREYKDKSAYRNE